MKKYTTFVVISVAILLLFSCKKSTEPVIPGWEVLSIGTNVELFKVDFVDSNYGWVIGRDTVVYHTTDGGNTWVRQSYPQYDVFFTELIDIQFIDRQLGWAVGDFNLIYKTTDGGTNWVIAESVGFGSGALRCIIFTDSSHGWVCGGSSAGFLRTTDGGNSWDSITSPFQIFLRDFIDSLNGWALGQGRSILHTSDGGLSWVNVFPGPVGSSAELDFVDLYQGWALISEIVSEYDIWFWILHTADGGYSWELQLDTFKYQLGNSALFTIEMFNANTGWISKWESKVASVLHTTNGGNSWIEQALPSIGDYYISDFDFVNEKEGWAVGNNGVLLRTKTGGDPIR